MNTALWYNERALRTLEELCASNRLPHALLVEGPEGCGKKTFAHRFAATALCEAPEKPCGVCSACVKVEKGIHPDLLFYAPAQGKKEFTIDLVREARQDAYIAPNEGNCKIYLFDRAHMMNTAAQNALLKILEEPPASVRFVLLCENRSRMLATILSRVTTISLAITSPEQCFQALTHLHPELDAGIRQAASVGSGGNIGRALALLDTAKPSRAAADAARLRETLLLGDRYTSLKVLSGYEKDREGLLQMLALLQNGILSLATARYRPGEPDKETERFLNRVTPEQALAAGRAVDRACQRCDRNTSISLLCACLVEEIKSVC